MHRHIEREHKGIKMGKKKKKSLRKVQAKYEPSSIQRLLDVLSSLTVSSYLTYLARNPPCQSLILCTHIKRAVVLQRHADISSHEGGAESSNSSKAAQH